MSFSYVYRILGLCIAWSFLSASVSAQTSELDSLNRLLNRTISADRKIDLLGQLTLAAISVDLQKARNYAEQAINLAEENNLSDQLPWARLNLAVCLVTSGETKEADKVITSLLEASRKSRDVSLKAYALNLRANLLRDQGNFDSAYSLYGQAARMIRPDQDPLFHSFAGLERTRYFLILSRPDSALRIIEKVLLQPIVRSQKQMRLEASILKARTLTQLFRYQEADALLDKVLSVTKPGSTPHLRARIIQGDIRFRQGDFPGSMKIWSNILEEGKQIGYRYDLANLLLQLGESYEEQGYWKIASQYLNSALAICDQSGFRFLKGEIIFEQAWIAHRSHEYGEGWQKARLAEKEYVWCNVPLRIGGIRNIQGLIKMGMEEYDSSLYFHLNALKIRENENDSISISSSLFNLGELYNLRKEYRKALSVLHRGVRIDKSIGDVYGESLYMYQLGRSHNGLNNFDSVEVYLNRAILLAAPNSSYEILQKSYFEMADFLQKTNKESKALIFLKKYINLRDSLYNKESAESMASYEVLFELDKKEKELSLVMKERELAERGSQLQEIVLYILSGVTVLVISMLIIYYRISSKLRVLNRSNTQKAEELSGANRALQGLYTDLQNNNRELKNTLNRLQETQMQLVKSEKMASLGVLSAGIAHELNNPLNFIKGSVTTLEMIAAKEKQIESVQAASYLQIIQEGVSRASAILQGLGQFSRQTDRMTEICDIHKILDNCLLILANSLKYHVTVQKDYTEKPFFLTGNEGKLHQAIINIISNAEQSIEDKGNITVTTRISDDSGIVSIQDTGCGIPKENLQRLGDLFFTTKEPGKGTGLGLSITYKIIEEHHGQIEVDSTLGEGTEFRLIFPGIK